LRLLRGELKHEVGRESAAIPAHGLLQNPSFDAIKLRQFEIEQDLLATEPPDEWGNIFRNEGNAPWGLNGSEFRFGRHGGE